MPAGSEVQYDRLLRDARPEMIESLEQYDSTTQRLSGLVRKGRDRSAGETRLMKLLTVLVRDYDQRHALPPSKTTPLEALRFLIEQPGRKPADLLPVFGQRSHVNEVLNGKRKIGLVHARKLGRLFSINPGVFVGRE